MKSNEQISDALRELMMPEPQADVLSPGLSIAEMRALYFDRNALQEPGYKLLQLNSRGGRYYYTFAPSGEPIFFPSVTTIIRAVAPENRFLTEWKLAKGKEAAEEYTMERANYGTFIHGQLAQLASMRKYNLDEVRERLTEYVTREKLPYGFIDAHEDEAKADIKAFARWMWEYDVRPYAIEVSLLSGRGYAGMIDLACNLRIVCKSDEASAIAKAKTAERAEEIRRDCASRHDAIVDFKTGKKGFYDEHAIQLELYRRMWNENFPDMQIEKIYNVAPKDWTKTVKKVPSFSFEEQTYNPVLNRVDLLLQLYATIQESERKVVIIEGTIDLDADPDGNVKIYEMSDLVKDWAEKREKTPDSAPESSEPINYTPKTDKARKTAKSAKITE